MASLPASGVAVHTGAENIQYMLGDIKTGTWLQLLAVCIPDSRADEGMTADLESLLHCRCHEN
jgi:hypothetical protein